MLQAVERQPPESTTFLEDRTTTQSPSNHQKEILVRILNRKLKYNLFI
jgi:hypothetical protein